MNALHSSSNSDVLEPVERQKLQCSDAIIARMEQIVHYILFFKPDRYAYDCPWGSRILEVEEVVQDGHKQLLLSEERCSVYPRCMRKIYRVDVLGEQLYGVHVAPDLAKYAASLAKQYVEKNHPGFSSAGLGRAFCRASESLMEGRASLTAQYLCQLAINEIQAAREAEQEAIAEQRKAMLSKWALKCERDAVSDAGLKILYRSRHAQMPDSLFSWSNSVRPRRPFVDVEQHDEDSDTPEPEPLRGEPQQQAGTSKANRNRGIVKAESESLRNALSMSIAIRAASERHEHRPGDIPSIRESRHLIQAAFKHAGLAAFSLPRRPVAAVAGAGGNVNSYGSRLSSATSLPELVGNPLDV